MTKSNKVVLGVFLAAIAFAWLNLLGGVLVVVRNAGDFVMEAVSVHVTDRDYFIGDVVRTTHFRHGSSNWRIAHRGCIL